MGAQGELFKKLIFVGARGVRKGRAGEVPQAGGRPVVADSRLCWAGKPSRREPLEQKRRSTVSSAKGSGEKRCKGAALCTGDLGWRLRRGRAAAGGWCSAGSWLARCAEGHCGGGAGRDGGSW